MKALLICIFSTIAFNLFSRGNYIVTVTLPDNSCDKSTLLLKGIRLKDSRSLKSDSVLIENGKAVITGYTEMEPYIATIRAPKQLGNYFVDFILEPGNVAIDLKAKYDNLVTGTTLNDAFFNEVTLPKYEIYRRDTLSEVRIQRLMNKTWTKEDEIGYNKFVRQHDTMYQRMIDKEKSFIHSHIENPEIILSLLFPYYNDTIFYQTIIDKLPVEFALRAKNDIARLSAMNKAAQTQFPVDALPESIPSNVAVGHKFLDIAGQTSEGEEIMLSQLLKGNRLTILDFWASWCAPCLAEMPFMNRINEMFKNDDVKIIGVSIDDNEVSWKKALGKYKMPWAHIRGHNIDKAYYILTIPSTIVIDDNGIIVARGLRREKLVSKIAELLKTHK